MEIAFTIFAALIIVGIMMVLGDIFFFFHDVPKQLKRIADALEKKGENDS